MLIKKPKAMEVLDRLSDLPDSIIHHILSFHIPTSDVNRMSLLSKRWIPICLSIPTLHFHDYESNNHKKLLKFMEHCLKHRQRPMSTTYIPAVHKFKLDITPRSDQGEDWKVVDEWLHYCVRQNVKEIDIQIWGNLNNDLYCFPLSTANHSISVTTLDLNGVKLESLVSITLPVLTTLKLENVLLDDIILQNLILGCPSLLNFYYSFCQGLSNDFNLRIPSTNLTCLSIYSENLSPIIVESPKVLRFFEYGSFLNGHIPHYLDVALFSFRSITSLSLAFVSFSDKWLEDLCHTLTGLGRLVLRKCYGFYHTKICIHQSKNFCLILEYDDHEYIYDKPPIELTLNLNMPNVEFFRYEGDALFSNVSLKAPNLLEAELRFSYPSSYFQNNFSHLCFLRSFDSCRKLSLTSTKALLYPEALREFCSPLLSTLKHLVIDNSFKILNDSELKKVVSWLTPSLETLTIKP